MGSSPSGSSRPAFEPVLRRGRNSSCPYSGLAPTNATLAHGVRSLEQFDSLIVWKSNISRSRSLATRPPPPTHATQQRWLLPRHDELQTGQLVSRANSDVTLVQNVLNMLPITTSNLLQIGISTGIMFWLSPTLTLVALAAL